MIGGPTVGERDDRTVGSTAGCRTGAVAVEVIQRPLGASAFGEFTISQILDGEGCPHRNGRVPASDEGSSFLILRVGGGPLPSGELASLLEPGDLVLVDSRSPLRQQTTPGTREVCVRLPGELRKMGMTMDEPALPCVIDGNSGIGIVLRAFVCSLLNAAGPFCAREEAAIGAALSQLTAAAFLASRERYPDCPAEPTISRVPRNAPARQWKMLQQSIEALLPDPELSPATVASSHRISTRQVHRLFRRAGMSFSRYVRSRRLAHCREELADPRFDALPLTEIAYRWGFSDSSHFSRCFKESFGCTAREFRARVRGFHANELGVAVAAALPGKEDAEREGGPWRSRANGRGSCAERSRIF